jgi:chemotaxis protein CheY-P-specific phosphatase CheC
MDDNKLNIAGERPPLSSKEIATIGEILNISMGAAATAISTWWTAP